MKVVVFLAVVAYSLAAEGPIPPKGALLVFPPEQNNSSTTTEQPTHRAPEPRFIGGPKTESFTVNNAVNPDVYYVQVPETYRLVQQPALYQQGSQPVQQPALNQRSQPVQQPALNQQGSQSVQQPALYQRSQPVQQPALYQRSQPLQVVNYVGYPEEAEANAEFLPLRVVTTEELAQYSSAQPANQNQARFQDSSNQNQFPARQQAAPSSQPSSYLASVRYSEVEPITGPVYSYTPGQLVRIVRYARK